MIIQEDGRVGGLSIVRATDERFARAVTAGGMRCRFMPALIDGRAIACTADYEIEFVLADEK